VPRRARLAPLAPAVAFLALAVAWSWPLPLYLDKRFAHDPGDPLLLTYVLWWNAHVVPLSDAMWSAPFYWPMRDSLALTDHGAGMGVFAAPIQWLGGSPLLAYNVLLIASTWSCGLAAFALVRRLTGSTAGALCAGLAFAFAPYRASLLAHLQLLVTCWMPLALLGLHGYYEDGKSRWLVLFGVAWLLLALTNGYYLFFFPILIALWILAFTPWRSRPRPALAVAAAWTVASLPLVPVLLKYYTVQTSLGLGRTRGEMQMYSATIDAFSHSSPLLRFWTASEGRTQEDFLFPGVTALTLIVAGTVAHRWRGVEARRFFFYIGAAGVMVFLAFGWLPLPGLRVPARFFMLATLGLAIAAGLAVAALNTTYPRLAKFITIAAVAGLLADGWIRGMPLGVPPRPFSTPLDRSGIVLELPVTDDNVNVAALYRGTLHGRPVVNGYAGYVPPHASVLDWALVRKDPSVLMELRRGHPLYVAVANHPEATTWSAFVEAQNGARLLEVGGAGRLYLLPAAPFARQVTIGRPVPSAGVERQDGWLTVDLGTDQIVRAVELRSRGHVVLLRATLRVETSVDGVAWTAAADEPTGGLALKGVLADPRAVPVRVILPDVRARFVRLDTPAFTAAAVTVFGPD